MVRLGPTAASIQSCPTHRLFDTGCWSASGPRLVRETTKTNPRKLELMALETSMCRRGNREIETPGSGPPKPSVHLVQGRGRRFEPVNAHPRNPLLAQGLSASGR